MEQISFSTHFSINNIPFGIVSSSAHPQPTAVTRFEDTIIFLDEVAKHGYFTSSAVLEALSQPVLNHFAALSKSVQQETRIKIQELLSREPFPCPKAIVHINNVTLHLPVSSGDFTDFSCSREHVLNAGEAIMKKRFLPPGFLHFPVGYTGRTSSIAVSGTPCIRPWGQFRDKNGDVVYGATQQLDYELEVACIIGKSIERGQRVNAENADDHIFGLVLLNDWSARDIQALEMVPLGPLNGKSFMTSISPWVITLEALKQFQAQAPKREVPVIAPYLQDDATANTFSINLQADLIVDNQVTKICASNLQSMYWTFRDLVAHQTSNGCIVNTGDILATGTISGETDDSHGCLLELTKGDQESFEVQGGLRRVYLEDGDIVRISAYAGHGVGFGECFGKVLPALIKPSS